MRIRSFKAAGYVVPLRFRGKRSRPIRVTIVISSKDEGQTSEADHQATLLGGDFLLDDCPPPLFDQQSLNVIGCRLLTDASTARGKFSQNTAPLTACRAGHIVADGAKAVSIPIPWMLRQVQAFRRAEFGAPFHRGTPR